MRCVQNLKKLVLITMLLLTGVVMCAKTTEKIPPKPLVTFVELGSVNCVPCKMMQPVMKEVEELYGDKIEVIFYDVWQAKNKAMGAKYKVRVIPTQVFLDAQGKEFHRHEGFYAKDEIVKIVDKQLGISRKPAKK